MTSNKFDCRHASLIPKTACFFSDTLDVYIDTSDGVNDDLQIQEYCGRIMSCVRMSKGKKFLFFKCSHSPKWSKNIEKIAEDNNGQVIPFFKWSFNEDFYSHTWANRENLREKVDKSDPVFDLGLFANFSKQYQYPGPSENDPRVSCKDINKFSLQDMLGEEKSTSGAVYLMNTRLEMLEDLKKTGLMLSVAHNPYKSYIDLSVNCTAVMNIPGVGEYTSRLFDQTAIGNLIIMRENSYDQGHSWKEYIPSVDFNSPDLTSELKSILESRDLWREKSRYYFDNMWSPKAIFDFFSDHIARSL
jgi:hypothetical protein|tara:strand:- start:43 stop:948 length:906 start_codon:yes stop_codon:yes gene_type:complete